MIKKMNNKIISIIFLVTLSLSFFVICTVLAETETYIFITKWGTQGSNEGQFNSPVGIAVDSFGNVFVVDAGNNCVQKFSNDGIFILQWGSYGSNDGQFNYTNNRSTYNSSYLTLASIAIDNADNVYVTDYYNNRIQKFTNNGVFLTKFNAYRSRDVAVDQTGNLYIPNYSNNSIIPNYSNDTIIQKFNSNGVWLASWNDSSVRPRYRYFVSIDIDNAGYIYVLDKSNDGTGRVLKLDNNGVIQNTWYVGGFEHTSESPSSLAVDNEGFIYIVGIGAGMQFPELNSSDQHIVYGVNKYTNSGKIVTRWGNSVRGTSSDPAEPGSGDGEFWDPQGVAVDNLGNVFVADTFNYRVQKFAKIPVVPEFSSTLILPLFIIITLLISIIYFKKHKTGR